MRTASSGTRVGISGFTKAARCGLGMANARGRRSHLEMKPEMVALAGGCAGAIPRRASGDRLRAIVAELEQQGYVNIRGESPLGKAPGCGAECSKV